MSGFNVRVDNHECDSRAPAESVSVECILPEAECQICVCTIAEGKLVALTCCSFKVCPDCYEQWSHTSAS